MSEHVNMPVRRLKALNYEEEFQSKGGECFTFHTLTVSVLLMLRKN